MRRRSTRRDLASLPSAAASAWLACIGNAAAQIPAPELTVAVFAEHYVAAGRAIDDLDVLESTVNAEGAKAVRLHACGDATARAQQAAAHRFRDRYLELRVIGQGSPGCQAAAGPGAMPVGLRSGSRPSGIDDAAVDRWWSDMVP